MGNHIVMAVLISLAAFSVWFIRPIVDVVPIFVWLIGLIASIVQALIFPLLTMAYIAGAVEEHEDHSYEIS
jgi:F0F1-type ATP synthase membrane subunit a